MKTPDEIKHGLECCYSPVEPMLRCEDCPYHGSIVCKMRLHIDALTIIRQLEARQTVAWTPVAAVLPKPGERVLICLENGFVGEGYLMHKGKWGRYDELGSVEEIFHCSVVGWMPMPESMKGEAE